jgi:uncharacterized glyoxalase superfamily protein PhnB
MTSIQPELWVDRAGAAIAFYQEAFGARVMHRVGDGDDIVAQLSVGRRRVLGDCRELSDAAVQPQGD